MNTTYADKLEKSLKDFEKIEKQHKKIQLHSRMVRDFQIEVEELQKINRNLEDEELTKEFVEMLACKISAYHSLKRMILNLYRMKGVNVDRFRKLHALDVVRQYELDFNKDLNLF